MANKELDFDGLIKLIEKYPDKSFKKKRLDDVANTKKYLKGTWKPQPDSRRMILRQWTEEEADRALKKKELIVKEFQENRRPREISLIINRAIETYARAKATKKWKTAIKLALENFDSEQHPAQQACILLGLAKTLIESGLIPQAQDIAEHYRTHLKNTASAKTGRWPVETGTRKDHQGFLKELDMTFVDNDKDKDQKESPDPEWTLAQGQAALDDFISGLRKTGSDNPLQSNSYFWDAKIANFLQILRLNCISEELRSSYLKKIPEEFIAEEPLP